MLMFEAHHLNQVHLVTELHYDADVRSTSSQPSSLSDRITL